MIPDMRKSFVKKIYNFVSSILLVDANFINLVDSNLYFSIFIPLFFVSLFALNFLHETLI